MKTQFKRVGFDAYNYSLVSSSDYDKYLSYIQRLKNLIESPDRRYTTTTFRDKTEIVCPFCGQREDFKVYNHMGWEWPSNMTHIMSVHGVTPYIEFLDSILRDTP